MKTVFALVCLVLFAFSAKGGGLSALSLDAMDWDIPNVVPWGWGKDTVFNYTNGGYIYSRNTPYSLEAACEFDIKVTKKLSRNNKAEVSLVLCDRDRSSRYLFGPVSKKNGSAKIELKLFVNGKYMNGKNCRINFKKGRNFRWKYDTKYRFGLSVKNGVATGKVWNADGELLAETEAVPNENIRKQAVFPMRTALYTSGLLAKFSKARAAFGTEVKMKDAPIAPPQKYVEKPHAPSIRGKKSGFFHVEQMKDGKYWIIDPNGYGFFANGIDAIYYRGNFCEALGYSPYYQNIKKCFPTVESWVAHTSKRLRGWGFNFIGTGDAALRKNFAYSINMMLGSSFASFGDDYNITPYKGRCNTALPNVFHSRFQEYCERKLANNKSRLNDPYCLGLFSDNELRWHGGSLNPDGSGVFDSVMEKNKKHTAKIALAAFLKKRYGGNIRKFNSIWNTQLNSFDDILQLKKLPHDNNERLCAKQDFLYLMAETYFRKVKHAMQNSSPNHMYLGCRSAGITSAHDKVWTASGKHCDIVTVNQYPVVDFDKGEIYVHLTGESFKEAFGRLHEMTGRPLMITEWSFLSMDSGLPNTRGAGQRVRTQKERAAAGKLFLRTCMSLPFMVGHNFYMYLDYPKQGARRTHPEDGNYGLANVKDEPYKLMTDMFAENQKTDPAIIRNSAAPEPLSKITAGNIYKQLTSATTGAASKSAQGFEVDNGIIKLKNDGKSAQIEVYYKNKYVGKYNLMARYLSTKSATVWTDADSIADIKICRAQTTRIEAVVKNRKFSYRTAIYLPPKTNYFMSEVIEVSNPSKSDSLILEGIYFRNHADFEIDFSKNHRYYDKYAYWVSKDGKLIYGSTATGARIAYYYHGTQQKQLPDGFYMFRKTLRAGETVKMLSPCYAFTFAAENEKTAQQTVRNLVRRDIEVQ